jgi:hypothetical protein
MACGRAAMTAGQTPTKVASSLWPQDDHTALLVRAATTPAALTNASQLARISAEFLAAMAPMSAGAALLNVSPQFDFNGAAFLNVPSFTASNTAVAFVAEGAPVPVVAFSSSKAQLVVRKLAAIVVATEELLEASPAAEMLLRDVLLRSTALAIDSVLFDTNPADGTRPAGLRNGVAAIPATPTGSDLYTTMIKDLSNLISVVAPIGGQIALVASRDRVANMKLRAQHPNTWRDAAFLLLPSSSLPNDTVMAVAVDGLISATDAAPTIRVSRDSLVNLDTAPPAQPGAPSSSLWQTRSVGLQVRFVLDWATRAANVISWVAGVNW